MSEQPITRSTEERLDMTSHLSEYVKDCLGPSTAFVLVAYSETNGKAVSQSLRGLASQLIHSISIRFTLRKPAEIRLHSPVEHSVLLALEALKLPETFAIRRQSRNRRELFSDRMILRHCGILSRVARPIGELAVFPNRFSFFAVWNDVIDRGVFEGKNLIMAKCKDRIQNRRSLPSQTQRTANNRRWPGSLKNL